MIPDPFVAFSKRPNPRRLRCPLCGQRFDIARTLRAHLRICAPPLPADPAADKQLDPGCPCEPPTAS